MKPPTAKPSLPWSIVREPSIDIFGKASYTLKIMTADGSPVALLGKDKQANADLIVRAVNAHEELLGLVKELHQVEISSGAREHFVDCSICEAVARAEAKS